MKSLEEALNKGYTQGQVPLNGRFTLAVNIQSSNAFSRMHSSKGFVVVNIQVAILEDVECQGNINREIYKQTSKELHLTVNNKTGNLAGLNKDYIFGICGGIILVNPRWNAFKVAKMPVIH